jgi:hypothetical protein
LQNYVLFYYGGSILFFDIDTVCKNCSCSVIMDLNSAYQVTKKISNIGISSYVTNHESEDDSYVILCIKLLEFIPVQFVYS